MVEPEKGSSDLPIILPPDWVTDHNPEFLLGTNIA
jgi:hypothetical protein